MGISWLSSESKIFFDDLVPRCGEELDRIPFGMLVRLRIAL
jgi:hypothetical protein